MSFTLVYKFEDVFWCLEWESPPPQKKKKKKKKNSNNNNNNNNIYIYTGWPRKNGTVDTVDFQDFALINSYCLHFVG